MPKIIIYPDDNGGICVVIPSPTMVGLLMKSVDIPAFISSELHNNSYVETSRLGIDDTMHLIAKKDVPAGVPYKIIDATDVPSDRTFREAWEADFTEFDGVGGAE